jgi:hypothetical protein
MDFILAYWHLILFIIGALFVVGWFVIRLRRGPRAQLGSDTRPPISSLFWGPSFVRWLDDRLGTASPKSRRRELILWIVFVVILIVGIAITPRKY